MDSETLKKRFCNEFPGTPDPDGCRSPGRVNLIGEHTDYNGLPVLPMTLKQEIRVAFSPAPDGLVTMRNISEAFSERVFANGPELTPSGAGSWDNYCKAAVQGLNRYFEITEFPGMNMLVDSDLPIAAGLSSSSSMVVASSLAYLRVLGKSLDEDITRLELAELLAEAEHFVGTRGGGMDQTVILNGESGHACKIDFFPIRVELTPLPEDCVIAVCDSLVHVEKSGFALVKYNTGPRLCALACALVEKQVREEICEEVSLTHLGDLWFGDLCLTSEEAEAICLRAVPAERVGLADAARRLETTPAVVREKWLDDLPEPEEGFDLRARLRHQLTEYRRVEDARDALQAGDSASFGKLMNASHESCAKDFHISSPELDTLTRVARKAGALGARLTGAGFGGATVNLVPKAQYDTFLETITESYYRNYMEYTGEVPVFAALPGDGAGYC